MKLILIILFPFLLHAQTVTPFLFDYEKAKYNEYYGLNKIQYPGDENIDVKYYKLDLAVTYTPQYIKGKVTVSAKSLIPSLKNIFLDLTKSLIVDSVVVSGISVPFQHNVNKIDITLDKEYSSGSAFDIIIYYKGKPGSSGFGSFAFSSHDGHPAIWSLSEPYGASDWWPCKDTPGDKADSADIIITVPTPLYAVSNGTLIKIINNDNGTDTYVWKSSYPIAHYLISVAISNYIEYRQYFKYSQSDSMAVNHYIYPERLEELKPELDRTVEMLKIFTPMFGPYPFIKEKYGHAQFQSGGMEHQTVTSIGTFNEEIIAHELAHQWFGDKVTCRDWQNIWLNEGFATYGAILYFESKYGKETYDNLISVHMGYSKAASGSIYVRDISKINEIFNGQRSYSKGAIVLHMLRGIVGDSVFFNILKEYLNDPGLSYGTAVTEDFQAAAERIFGDGLYYFFNEWIYGENYPKYNVVWTADNNAQGYLLKINVNQEINTSPQYFSMPVQIKVAFRGTDTLFTVFNNKTDQQFSFQFNKEPLDVVFDPNNYILKEISYGSGSQSPVSFRLEQNYPNPFNNGTTIPFRIGRRKFIKLSINNILGEEIAVLLNEELLPGFYSIRYDPADLPSGIYFFTLSDRESIETKKMILLR